jgi:CHASE2 domain-containing sensor protein
MMCSENSPNYKYQPGGSLPPDAPTYVTRQADREFYQALLNGEYCYILNARQMGKSSLRIHTMENLKSQGVTCAEIELSGIGSQQITPQQWYGGIIQELISGFRLSLDRRRWLQAHDDLSPVQRLSQFIETILLTQVQTSLVIFIDEIDSVLGLNFLCDDFFVLIRNCYEKRATKPEYQRLTFALLGAATPSDLIQDPHATPFNIGHAIELRGFQLDECYPLMKGLERNCHNPLAILKAILDWTGGQPFLTQKLCWLAAVHLDFVPNGKESDWINHLVRTHLIEHWESKDEPEHLRTIRDRILRNSSRTAILLELYQQIIQRGQIPARNTPEYLELRLSGLVIKQQDGLVVFNRIYHMVFDRKWLNHHLDVVKPTAKSTPIWQLLVVSLLVALAINGLRSLGLLQQWELQSFDQFMQLRPPESPDPRLLLITIDEQDVQSQPVSERGVASLSDPSLNRLLTKLEQAKPRAIGLDIYRDYAVRSGFTELEKRLQQSANLVAICHYSDSQDNSGVPAPSAFKPSAQGFNNVLLDSDRVIRRQLLAVGNAVPCANKFSFNLQLAKQYLKQENISIKYTPDGYIQLGTVVFKTIESNSAAYHRINASGHQILLNYRASRQISEKISLQKILDDDFDPDIIRDRVILIGTIAQSFQDTHWQTPYNKAQDPNKQQTKIAGVEIQAHMVSQLLSAVLDRRPLIWSFSEPMEILWITAWAVVGGLVGYGSKQRSWWFARSGVVVLSLYCGCFVMLLVQGAWLPFVPAIITFMLSGSLRPIFSVTRVPAKK